MIEGSKPTSGRPEISIIVATYDDWGPLDGCLRSFADQTDCPEFEVIVVDDGSTEPASESIRQWRQHYPLSIVRQSHAGIPSARNRGVQNSRGQILVFTDSDCRFRPNCLSALASAVIAFREHNCFQLHLVGDGSSLLGRAEHLRLITLQNQMLQPDGRIRYLNTAGFAIRKTHASVENGLFNPVALRGEDTLLLATFMQQGELPLFVKDATVQHSISLSHPECLKKDARSAWLEGRTGAIIRAKGVKVRMRNIDRFKMLQSLWRQSHEAAIGREAFFVLLTRQLVERTVSFLYKVCAPSR